MCGLCGLQLGDQLQGLERGLLLVLVRVRPLSAALLCVLWLALWLSVRGCRLALRPSALLWILTRLCALCGCALLSTVGGGAEGQ